MDCRKGKGMENLFSLKKQLQFLEEQLLQPEVRKSAKDLAILLADEFIEFGSSGRVYNKQQVISGLPTSPTVQMKLMDFQVKLLAPDVALTVYRLVKDSEQSKEKKYSLRSSIWRLQRNHPLKK